MLGADENNQWQERDRHPHHQIIIVDVGDHHRLSGDLRIRQRLGGLSIRLRSVERGQVDQFRACRRQMRADIGMCNLRALREHYGCDGDADAIASYMITIDAPDRQRSRLRLKRTNRSAFRGPAAAGGKSHSSMQIP